ncbi:MAG: hypothetical protein ACP5UA_01450 [Candidatus Hydrogenedens sp.]
MVEISSSGEIEENGTNPIDLPSKRNVPFSAPVSIRYSPGVLSEAMKYGFSSIDFVDDIFLFVQS